MSDAGPDGPTSPTETPPSRRFLTDAWEIFRLVALIAFVLLLAGGVARVVSLVASTLGLPIA